MAKGRTGILMFVIARLITLMINLYFYFAGVIIRTWHTTKRQKKESHYAGKKIHSCENK
jgi:hypothetical protein